MRVEISSVTLDKIPLLNIIGLNYEALCKLLLLGDDKSNIASNRMIWKLRFPYIEKTKRFQENSWHSTLCIIPLYCIVCLLSLLLSCYCCCVVIFVSSLFLEYGFNHLHCKFEFKLGFVVIEKNG